MTRPNVLLVTLDQFRGDALSCAGHPLVQTPNLDALAARGVLLRLHYAQAAPCAPGRAALYTGTYQMTNRVVANGTPLDDRFDNIARVARRAGYTPTLFGYTDQGVDPRLVDDRSDPRLSDYEGVLAGFEVGLDLPGPARPWLAWLAEHGYDLDDADRALETEPDRPAELSQSAFLTNHLLDWLDRQEQPWFAHASYLRPHPPYAAAGHWARRYDPADVPAPLPVPAPEHRLGLYRALLRHPLTAGPTDPAHMARLRAQYFAMCSEVDDQLGRVFRRLEELGQLDDTVVVVTADHGEQLGDQGLVQKGGFYASSYHIVGIVVDPRRAAGAGRVVDEPTENVDLLPTLCELMSTDAEGTVEPPAQAAGRSLVPFLDGERPDDWREAAHYEWDWRETLVAAGELSSARLDEAHLAVRLSSDRAYVHFGNGSWRCYDLAADPTWQSEVTDPSIVLAEAQAMLDWRGRHLDRTMTGFLLRDGGIGRFPFTPG